MLSYLKIKASQLYVMANIWQICISCRRYLIFLHDFCRFRKLSRDRPDLLVTWRDRYPCLHDNVGSTAFDRHYVFHTAWAARVVTQIMPAKHVDISSSLYFCSILSSLIPVDFYDYRPAALGLDNLCSEQVDLLCLPFEDESISSLSCMHVVEHVGLGRYGDKMDSHGDLRAITELKRVLAPKGNLLFVVPVGKPRIMFNAHRIYSYAQILCFFKDLKLKEFALIPDDELQGGLIRCANPALVMEQSYACGCFWFQK